MYSDFKDALEETPFIWMECAQNLSNAQFLAKYRVSPRNACATMLTWYLQHESHDHAQDFANKMRAQSDDLIATNALWFFAEVIGQRDECRKLAHQCKAILDATLTKHEAEQIQGQMAALADERDRMAAELRSDNRAGREEKILSRIQSAVLAARAETADEIADLKTRLATAESENAALRASKRKLREALDRARDERMS